MSARSARAGARVTASLVAAAVFASAPATGLGDGDPASDMLLGRSVFYPFTTPVSPALRRRLDAETALAARAGFPIKVALIAARGDLGTISPLIGSPQRYASFLDIEIAYRPLLVVMGEGYGAAGLGGPVGQVLDTLRRPAGDSGDQLARSAITAVAALAASAGHPLPGYSAGGAGEGSWSGWPVVAGLGVLAAVVCGAILTRRRRSPTV